MDELNDDAAEEVSADIDDEVEEVVEEPLTFPNQGALTKRLEQAKRAEHRRYGGLSPEQVSASLQRLEDLETDQSTRDQTHKQEVKRLKEELASTKQSNVLRERLAGAFLAQGGLPDALSVGVDSLLSRVDPDISQSELESVVPGFIVTKP